MPKRVSRSATDEARSHIQYLYGRIGCGPFTMSVLCAQKPRNAATVVWWEGRDGGEKRGPQLDRRVPRMVAMALTSDPAVLDLGMAQVADRRLVS